MNAQTSISAYTDEMTKLAVYSERCQIVAWQIAKKLRCQPMDILVEKQFGDGLSGDLVLLIRILNAPDQAHVGSFVLKISAASDGGTFVEKNAKRFKGEIRNTEEVKSNTNIGAFHIPRCILSHDEDPLFYVYDFAGNEVKQGKALSKQDKAGKCSHLEEIAKRLMTWGTLSNRSISICEIIRRGVPEERLGWMSLTAERIDVLIKEKFANSFMFNETHLPNPLFYAEQVEDGGTFCTEKAKLPSALFSLSHGDLNTNNIVVTPRRGRRQLTYSLIDFAYYEHEAPLFYDHAYLMFTACLEQFAKEGRDGSDCECVRLEDWQKAFDIFFNEIFSIESPKPPQSTILSYMCAVQSAVDMFIGADEASGNRPVLQKQCLAAHVSAGLRCIGKKELTQHQQSVSLLYAANAVKRLMYDLEIKMPDVTRTTPILGLTNCPDEGAAWKQIGYFSQENRYILITPFVQSGFPRDALVGLASVRWASVIEVASQSLNYNDDNMRDVFMKYHSYCHCPLSQIDSPEIGPLTPWIQMRLPFEEADVHYRRHFSRKLEDILRIALSRDSNEPLYILCNIADFDTELYKEIVKTVAYIGSEMRTIRIVTCGDTDESFFRSSGNIMHSMLNCSLNELSEIRASQSPEYLDSDSIRLPVSENISKEASGTAIGYHIIPPESAKDYASVMTLVHRNIARDATDDDGMGFYRGGEATWLDIQERRDIERDCYVDKWREVIENNLDLSHGENRQLYLYHAPGSGGSTMKKRIAWDYCGRYPTAILHDTSEVTVRKLSEIHQYCDRPLLLLAEVSDGDIKPESINAFRALLQRNEVRALLICVSRVSPTSTEGHVTTPPANMALYLPNNSLNNMSAIEGSRFAKLFKRLVNKSDSRYSSICKQLDELAGDSRERECHPFFFGFTVFGDEYTGISKYVSHVIDTAAQEEKGALKALAFITQFSQTINLKLAEIHQFMYAQAPKSPEADELFKIREWAESRPIVVNREGGYRLIHPIIAQAVLERMLDSKSYREALMTFATSFASTIKKMYITQPVDSRKSSIIRELFMHREVIEDEYTWKPRFSQLLMVLEKRELGTALFKHLCSEFPDNPHCRSHLARVYLYPIVKLTTSVRPLEPEFSQAEQYAREAIDCAERNGLPISSHCHVLAKVFTEKCRIGVMKSQSMVSGTILEIIAQDYEEALRAFDRSMSRSDMGYGLIGKIQLAVTILDAFKNLFMNHSRWIDFNKDTVFVDILSMASDAMTKYKYSVPITTSFFTEAVYKFYSHVRNIGALRQCLVEDSLSLDQRAKINRAVAGLLVNSPNDINNHEIELAFHHTDENVQNGKDTEVDRWNWLELYRRLPEKFSLIRAFDFVMNWPGGEQRQDVLYYRYVLAFMLYQRGSADIAVQMVRRLLSDCENMARKASFSSKAKTPHTTLDFFGKINAENDAGLFLSFPVTKKVESGGAEDARIKESMKYRLSNCDRFIGILGRRNRILRIGFLDRFNTEFFAESPHLSEYNLKESDISGGARVAFHLGFSCSGMRAWDIELL